MWLELDALKIYDTTSTFKVPLLMMRRKNDWKENYKIKKCGQKGTAIKVSGKKKKKTTIKHSNGEIKKKFEIRAGEESDVLFPSSIMFYLF